MSRSGRASAPLFVLLLSATVSATCFRPNGSIEANLEYQPCSSDLSNPLNTICCATNRTPDRGPDICTPNGLCQVGMKKGEKPRDPTWTKPQCTNSDWKGCLEVCGKQDMAFVTPCDTAAGNSSRRWCCGYLNKDCCNEDAGLAIETLALKFGVNPTSTTSSSSSSSSLLPVTLPTSSPTPAPSSSPATAAAEDVSKPKQDTGLSDGAKAGLGIGVVLLVAALLGIGYWIGTRLRDRNAASASSAPPNPYSMNPYPVAPTHAYPDASYNPDVYGRGAAPVGPAPVMYYKYEANDTALMELPAYGRVEVESREKRFTKQSLVELPDGDWEKKDWEKNSLSSMDEKRPR